MQVYKHRDVTLYLDEAERFFITRGDDRLFGHTVIVQTWGDGPVTIEVRGQWVKKNGELSLNQKSFRSVPIEALPDAVAQVVRDNFPVAPDAP